MWFSRREATAFLLPQLISALPYRARAAPHSCRLMLHIPGVVPEQQSESNMKIREKRAVFEAQKITSDMLMLALQALIVGAAAAMLSGILIAAVVSLMS